MIQMWCESSRLLELSLVCYYYNTKFVSRLNNFRPRVSTNLGKMSFKLSAPKIKCLPYHKFKKEWKFYLLINQIWFQPCLYVLLLILLEIVFPLLLLPIIWTWPAVSNKKSLVATLDTVTELISFSLMIFYQLLMFSYLRTLTYV